MTFRRRGLTVIEIIIAALILIVVSITIIRAFMSSEELNRRSLWLDKAVFASVRLLEDPGRLLVTESNKLLEQENLLKYSKINLDDGRPSLVAILDENFEPLNLSQKEFDEQIKRPGHKNIIMIYSVSDLGEFYKYRVEFRYRNSVLYSAKTEKYKNVIEAFDRQEGCYED